VINKKKTSGPQFVRYFAPLLDALRALGGSGSPQEVIQRIVEDLNISDEMQNDFLSSGQSRFVNQVHWARFYLVKEGLLDSSKRGVWTLSERGLKTNLTDSQALALFQKLSRMFQIRDGEPEIPEEAQIQSPEDDSSEGTGDYRVRLLDILLKLPPSGFERLAQRLLREAGFSQVVVTGKSNDGGIDGHGTLMVNPLVSFRVLFQCKRYAGAVSSPDVRNFRGAMQGRADKGIIITTGSFTADAIREASRDGAPPIELIDGGKLIDLMKGLRLGLKPIETFSVDDAFFNEFRV
jgi:restriction system protein